MTDRPSQTEDIYARLGVSRSSLTQEHLTYMYRQKCAAWSPHMNCRFGSFEELDALREAYDTVSFHLETQKVIGIAVQEMAKAPRPVGKRAPMTLDTVQCVRRARAEAHLSQYQID
ncbi:hypothetical protein KY359_00220 [Candidatus Woesearchaeota archaeon]|nr:hypothetical protein [Candidatus Woesearchaeota archaeon]